MNDAEKMDRQARILEAVIHLLARHGISGVSMRAVAREAGVALGLVNYHYDDKTSLIRAALHRVADEDIATVAPDPSLAPDERLHVALHRVADSEFLTTDYLSLRLQLWALAQAHDDFAQINTEAEAVSNRSGRPHQGRATRALACRVHQTGGRHRRHPERGAALLGLDLASVRRSVVRCEQIALGSA